MTDDIERSDLISDRDGDIAQMTVERDETVSVVDLNEQSV